MTNSLLLNIAMEIVDLSMKHDDFPWFFVSLPEGISPNIHVLWWYRHQWPFQEPKLEVPTIYKAYFLGLYKGTTSV